ncbi:Galactose oxidase, central domain containing protein, putative [Trypanosoma equiperdum]|uniref:Galactose oxidase, central domain containing protein, putative n=1 Tax=Trypanosoma equiperdum TaxID=5694 RepID=A0A1G4I8L1_TRYEQ|nr:Galactose oxidase, central domain containing protein, putative [Trypanosoma equiperdum]
MEWVPCTEQTGSVGCREGHCATSLQEKSTGEEWVLVVGGYCEGERDGAVMAARADGLPMLRWVRLDKPNMTWFECDGASLTHVTGDTAYFFGGLNEHMNHSNQLLCLSLHQGQQGDLSLDVVKVETTGDVPLPRARHSAGSAGRYFVVFGGETEDAEQNNDGYILDTDTMVWTRIPTGHQVPNPRLLAGPLVFYSPHECILYGGAHFVNGDIRSMSDVWNLHIPLGGTWFNVSYGDGAPACRFPRSNGHAGGVLGRVGGETVVVFVGGKDAAEGCDRVKQVQPPKSAEDKFHLRLVDPVLAGGEGPHWRYTPAAVDTRRGVLLLGGQCRHPQEVAAFLLKQTGVTLQR